MKEEIRNKIESAMAQVKLTPFNMELATYENTHPEESDTNYDEFSKFSTVASKDGFDLIRVDQIRIDIPIDVSSQIKDIEPAFIVYAGTDSIMECIGYPHGEMIYKVPASKQPTYCIFGNVALINGGVIINQFDVCDNCTVTLFDIDHYREAQFFSMDPRRNDGISIEDLEQYAEEVLNLKFEEDK